MCRAITRIVGKESYGNRIRIGAATHGTPPERGVIENQAINMSLLRSEMLLLQEALQLVAKTGNTQAKT
jgi:hypothetical protein